MSRAKHYPLLPQSDLLYTAWNAISRIDVYPLSAAPNEGWPAPGFSIVVDGGSAATAMGNFGSGLKYWLEQTEHRPSGLAYVGKKRPKVLILGAGAGREVFEGLYFNAASITAVEVNPIIADIVARRMPNSFSGLYQQPNVRLVVDEARSFVRRSKETYDVIIAVRASSRAALVSGALGVAEGYMYTREALEDYFDHLNADGVLLIAFSPLEVARLFATAREVFEARGLGSPARHLVAALVPPDLWGPRHSVVAFLLKKSPWTPAELQMMVERLTFSANGNTAGDILYSPFEADTDSIYHQGSYDSRLVHVLCGDAFQYIACD